MAFSEEVLDELLDYRKTLLRMAVNMVGPTAADDAVQETMLKALKWSSNGRKTPHYPKAWIGEILLNVIRSTKRKQRTAGGEQRQIDVDQAYFDSLRSEAPDPHRIAVSNEVAAKVEELPPRQQQVVKFLMEGLTFREIAQETKITEIGGRTSFFHAKQTLRSMLGPSAGSRKRLTQTLNKLEH